MGNTPSLPNQAGGYPSHTLVLASPVVTRRGLEPRTPCLIVPPMSEKIQQLQLLRVAERGKARPA